MHMKSAVTEILPGIVLNALRFAFAVSGVFCAALIPAVSAVAAEKHCPLLRGALPLHPLPKEVAKVPLCSAAQSPHRSPVLHLAITPLGKVGTCLLRVSLPRLVRASHYFLPPTLSQPPLFPHLTMHHHILTEEHDRSFKHFCSSLPCITQSNPFGVLLVYSS